MENNKQNKRHIWIFLIISVLVLCVYTLRPNNVHNVIGLEKTHVVRIVDGDTLVVDKDGGQKIRLIGVDTPESVDINHPERNCEEGKIATEYLKDLVEEQDVYLEFDSKYKDRFDRVLAYVYLDEDGKTMVQVKLLEDGMAQVMPVRPNLRYKSDFEKVQETAKESKTGFWGTEYFK